MEEMAIDQLDLVFREMHPRLWRALYAFSGDADLASEAESEAFTQAAARGDDLRDVAAWVWRSAFKIAGGLAKKRSERAATTVEWVDEMNDELSIDIDIVAFVSQLQSLSRQQRACVVLRYVGGFDSEGIADLLQTTPGVVRVQLHRAHEKLRNEMEATR